MTPLHGQRPLAEDPFDDTPAEKRMRSANRAEPKTEPGFKVPYSMLWKIWAWIQPSVIPALASIATALCVALGIMRAGSADTPKAAPAPVSIPVAAPPAAPDDLRRLESRLDEHIQASDRRWEKTDKALEKINDYLLQHAGDHK